MEPIKKICAIDFVLNKQIGGPYINSKRIMSSGLNAYYEFRPIFHDLSLGRGVSFKRIRDIASQLKAANPDIFLINGLQLGAFHSLLASFMSGKRKNLIIIRGFSFDALDISLFKRAIMLFIIEPLSILLSDGFIGNSKFSSTRLISRIFFWKNKGFVYNFMPVGNDENYEIERNLINFTKQHRTIISVVGRVTKDKGYEVLLSSIAEISKKRTDFLFVIAGDGAYLNEFKERVKSLELDRYVFFLGETKNISLINHYASIFVLPSLHETLSSSLIEASSARCALVASDNGGIREIVQHGYNGFRFRTGDPKELADRIISLLENKTLTRCMGENAKEFINKRFSNFNSERLLKNFLDHTS